MSKLKRDDRTHTATRVIDAPPATIYKALTDPKRLVQWLPPDEATGHIDIFEPHPGGRFKMTLTFPTEIGKSSSNTDVVTGKFVELQPGTRIVQAFTFESDKPELAGLMTMAWSLSPETGGTRVTITATDVPRGIGRADHEAGMNDSLANLAAFASRSG